MKLGHKQLRLVNFLKASKKPAHVSYRGSENRRIVDSLERRGIIEVFRYSPEFAAASISVLVTPNTNHKVFNEN